MAEFYCRRRLPSYRKDGLYRWQYGIDEILSPEQSKGALRLKVNQSQSCYISAMITYKDGKMQKEEFNFGSSFLSQSGRFMAIGPAVASVTIRSIDDKIRTINFQ